MHMRSLARGTLCAALLVIMLFTACASAGRERSSPASKAATSALSGAAKPDTDISRLEMKIHALINKERKKRGLSALAWSEDLHRIARRYSRDMARRVFFSHHDPEGRGFMDRYNDEGFACKRKVGNATCLGAENIAQENLYASVVYLNGVPAYNWNSEDEIARSVVKSWMKSKGHRENILTSYFRQQGIGIAISDDGRVYVTENFC